MDLHPFPASILARMARFMGVHLRGYVALLWPFLAHYLMPNLSFWAPYVALFRTDCREVIRLSRTICCSPLWYDVAGNCGLMGTVWSLRREDIGLFSAFLSGANYHSSALIVCLVAYFTGCGYSQYGTLAEGVNGDTATGK